jgi:hypothetical protein
MQEAWAQYVGALFGDSLLAGVNPGVVQLNPDLVEGYTQLGRLASKVNRTNEAIHHVHRAVATDSPHAEA